MNDITSLRDCLIADEITRIRTLDKDALEKELIELVSSAIEQMSESDLFAKCKSNL